MPLEQLTSNRCLHSVFEMISTSMARAGYQDFGTIVGFVDFSDGDI